ncbi:MAG TPA: hypothetical protein VFD04_05165 [Actinomycetes bacterium]|nr:hypothetical protein [Actinomycetes bacterium]
MAERVARNGMQEVRQSGRFIARRWASFVGPLRAKLRRADDSAGPVGRARIRAQSEKPIFGYAAITRFIQRIRSLAAAVDRHTELTSRHGQDPV